MSVEECTKKEHKRYGRRLYDYYDISRLLFALVLSFSPASCTSSVHAWTWMWGGCLQCILCSFEVARFFFASSTSSSQPWTLSSVVFKSGILPFMHTIALSREDCPGLSLHCSDPTHGARRKKDARVGQFIGLCNGSSVGTTATATGYQMRGLSDPILVLCNFINICINWRPIRCCGRIAGQPVICLYPSDFGCQPGRRRSSQKLIWGGWISSS